MAKGQDSWTRMFAALERFRQEHGHCNVPATFPEDPQLGRWVAAQRYKKKVKGLSEKQIASLDDLGFVWSASDRAWEEMFLELCAFKQEYGHCNVPTQWEQNANLAGWVQRQRHRKKRGRLSRKRAERMEEMGFSWSIYRGDKNRPAAVKEEEAPAELVNHVEKLYRIGVGLYIQHNGNGDVPPQLAEYMRHNGGELPPYIPLPHDPVEFRLGEGLLRCRKVAWSGKGALPVEVLAFVTENGTLPPHEW